MDLRSFLLNCITLEISKTNKKNVSRTQFFSFNIIFHQNKSTISIGIKNPINNHQKVVENVNGWISLFSDIRGYRYKQRTHHANSFKHFYQYYNVATMHNLDICMKIQHLRNFNMFKFHYFIM